MISFLDNFDSTCGWVAFCGIVIHCIHGEPVYVAMEAHNNFPKGKVYTKK